MCVGGLVVTLHVARQGVSGVGQGWAGARWCCRGRGRRERVVVVAGVGGDPARVLHERRRRRVLQGRALRTGRRRVLVESEGGRHQLMKIVTRSWLTSIFH